MTVFDFKSYKQYLKKALDTSGKTRGARSKLASFLNCQTGYISQVLGGHTHFSLEHSTQINDFLKHDEDESHFFMLLVQFERAGSTELRAYFRGQLEKILEKRAEVQSRIPSSSTLSKEDHMEYYSQWYYAAIHVAVSIHDYQTMDSIAERFNLNFLTVKKTINFLLEKSLITQNGDRYLIGPTRIHLNRASPMISKHHSNWRVHTLKSLETNNNSDLHYSSVVTLSNKDFIKIKNILLNSIEQSEEILASSPEEEIFAMSIDCYKL